MVHQSLPAGRNLSHVLTKYHLEPKRMQLVYPYIDREPNMVLDRGSERRKFQNYGGKTADCVRKSRECIQRTYLKFTMI